MATSARPSAVGNPAMMLTPNSLSAKSPRLLDASPQLLAVVVGGAQDAHATSVGHGGGHRRHRYEPHRAQADRVFDTEQFGEGSGEAGRGRARRGVADQPNNSECLYYYPGRAESAVVALG